MPLSKERDRKRKQLRKLKDIVRLESKSATANSNLNAQKKLDADGNSVPDYW